MSSSFWWNSEDFNNQILVKYPTPSNNVKIYIDSGDSGTDNDDEAVSRSVVAFFLASRSEPFFCSKPNEYAITFWS